MTFLVALGFAQVGYRIRRKAWSQDPHSDDFHYDLVIREEGRVVANHSNAYFPLDLHVADYRAKDWIFVEASK